MIESHTFISKSSCSTFAIGVIIGKNLGRGDIVALSGELGAGKTCITKGIAEGLGLDGGNIVTSPTFALLQEYPGSIPLYHFDIYRLAGSDDMDDLGYEEYFYGKGVTVIEWAERIQDVLPDKTLFISMKYLNDNERLITFWGKSEKIFAITRALIKGGFI